MFKLDGSKWIVLHIRCCYETRIKLFYTYNIKASHRRYFVVLFVVVIVVEMRKFIIFKLSSVQIIYKHSFIKV
jgi:hypothetical protein